MANYSLVMNPFQARSFDDMVKPYAMLTEAYNSTLTEFDTLEAATDMLDRLISKDKDPGARALYDRFVQDLLGVSEDLLRNGLSPNSRRTLHRLRSYYNKYITAIQNAVTAKQAQVKQLQTLQAADDSIIPERDILGGGKEASLDRWLEDPNYTYGRVFSPRKDAEQKAKGVAQDAATLRSAIAWANAERSDYIQRRRTYMHPAAATFFNMLEAQQFEEAYKTLLKDYPLKGVTGLEYGSGYYAEGGYMDESNGLPPFARTWVDLTTSGGGASSLQTAQSAAPARSTSPASRNVAPPAILQERRGEAEDRQERAESRGSGSGKSRGSGSGKKGNSKKKKADTSKEGFKGLNVPYISIVSPDLESGEPLRRIDRMMSMLGLPTDLDELRNFDWSTYQGASVPGLAFAPYTDFGQAAILATGNGYALVRNLENYKYKWFSPVKDMSEVTFGNDVASVPFTIDPAYRDYHGIMSVEGMMNLYDQFLGEDAQNKAYRAFTESYADIYEVLDEYFEGVPITVQNVPPGANVPLRPHIYTGEDIIRQRLEIAQNVGPTEMAAMNIRFNDTDKAAIMSYLLNMASLTDDKVAILPITGWDKHGNLKLGENEDLSKWATTDSGSEILKPTRLPEFLVVGNENMRGLILKHRNKYYFMPADALSQSTLSEALCIPKLILGAVIEEQDYKNAIISEIKKNNPGISDEDLEAALVDEFYNTDFYSQIVLEKQNYSLDMQRKLAMALRQVLKVPEQDIDKTSYDESEFNPDGTSISNN